MALVDLIDTLRSRLAEVEPSEHPADECAALVAALASLGKACDALRARLAARAVASAAHRRRGFADASEWLAAETGVTATDAQRAIDTAAAVEGCPATLEAWRAGEVSLLEAAEIAKTEAVCPGTEQELLSTARRAPLRVLRERARATRLDAIDVEELARRQRKARGFRHWRDELGMIRFAGGLTPAAGVAFLSRLDAEAERLRRRARREGVEEPWEAHAADALVALTEGPGSGPARPGRADVVFVCDIAAYRREHAAEGERCHVVGGGPVPVSEVREAVENDAFLKVAFHEGARIHTIKHFGRHLRAELRTALELGPPPGFAGQECGCGCGRRYKLQVDHVQPLAAGGPTSFANLQPRTATEHAEKTRRDRAAGLLRGPVGARGP